MSLEDLRSKIDEIDTRIVRLIGERTRIAEEIGGEKKKQGKQINDLTREQKVLANIKRLAESEQINQEVIEAIYQQIVNLCRMTQGTEVAFQGEAGAYSQEAALQFFGRAIITKPYETLEKVFSAVEHGDAPFGIVPVENSLEGSISPSYDLLRDSILKVCGETELRVAHCLIANPRASLDSIKRVYSHPQALGQCKNFIKHLGCEIIPTYDTAGAVKMIKEQGIIDGSAIASARAAEIYQMKIIASEIEDYPHNFTRFFILAKEDSPPSGNDKTSIVFAVKHKPKALYDFIKNFAASDVNLTKIESRPTRRKAWDYNFYLDFDGHREDAAPREVLAKLEQSSIFLKILGSYPKAK